MADYLRGSVRSADGTTIGYRQYGDGPGLIVVHGGMKAAQHYSALATALSNQFRVYVPDRRGRGSSGPHGPDYGIDREVEDVQALIAATGSRLLFGHSAGALISLRAAAATPALDRVALYEPPLPVGGSVPTGWMPRFERELAAGRRVAAAVTALKGSGLEPTFARHPRWLLTGIVAIGLRTERPGADETSIAALIPTMRHDVHLAETMADTAADHATLRTPVLLLGGTRSPTYLDTALRELEAALPDTRRVTLDGLDHAGPEDDGRPLLVAEALREFFSTP